MLQQILSYSNLDPQATSLETFLSRLGAREGCYWYLASRQNSIHHKEPREPCTGTSQRALLHSETLRRGQGDVGSHDSQITKHHLSGYTICSLSSQTIVLRQEGAWDRRQASIRELRVPTFCPLHGEQHFTDVLWVVTGALDCPVQGLPTVLGVTVCPRTENKALLPPGHKAEGTQREAPSSHR